mmetsp:Transcript_182103/g.443083  ORF Transcript_182103/g.443083 Transcript_182103/m.443083 type:complete len:238 (+) Transcript_182103:2-715(+)
MCSLAHNGAGASCSGTGPPSVWDCHDWFHNLWQEQIPWLEAGLNASTADWQVVVTHFPADFRINEWAPLAETYGIDLIVAGHRHQEEVHYEDGFAGGILGSTAWVVAGGGGGITSECTPRLDGQDNCYGFMDVAVTKDELRIDAISHGGVLRSSTKVRPRRRSTTTTATQATPPSSMAVLASMQDASAAGGQPSAGGTRLPASVGSSLAGDENRTALTTNASNLTAKARVTRPLLLL